MASSGGKKKGENRTVYLHLHSVSLVTVTKLSKFNLCMVKLQLLVQKSASLRSSSS